MSVSRSERHLLCTHLLYDVDRLCKRIGIIVAGRTVVEGSVDDLLRTNQQCDSGCASAATCWAQNLFRKDLVHRSQRGLVHRRHRSDHAAGRGLAGAVVPWLAADRNTPRRRWPGVAVPQPDRAESLMTPMALIARKEAGELLMAGRGIAWLLAMAIALSAFALLLVSDTELSLLDNAQVVYDMVGIVTALGALLAVVVGTDAIAGERERGRLVPLLLTPVPRTTLLFGKLGGQLITWAVMYAIAIPYLWAVGSTGQNLADSILALALFGTPTVLGLVNPRHVRFPAADRPRRVRLSASWFHHGRSLCRVRDHRRGLCCGRRG